MADEKITPDFVNRITRNAIRLQNAQEDHYNLSDLRPDFFDCSYVKAWYYKDLGLYVLYEKGLIVYKDKVYDMNDETCKVIMQNSKDQEKAEKRQKFKNRKVVVAAGTITSLAIALLIVSSMCKTTQSDEDTKATEKYQSVKDSVPINDKDTISFIDVANQYRQNIL